jgi:hypothetical protein
MTIEKLGLMMAKVLETMATKDDLENPATKDSLVELEEKLSAKINSLHNRQDIYAVLDRKATTFGKRLTKVEDKVGV